MTNKEKLQKLSVGKNPQVLEEIKFRNANRIWLKNSKKIALEILLKLDELGWTQTQLAEHLGVSKQYVNKLLKGNEKFGFEVLSQLEEILGLCLFSVNIMEKKYRNAETNVFVFEKTKKISIDPKQGIIIPMATDFSFASANG